MELAVWLGNSSTASLSPRLQAKLFILGKIAKPRDGSLIALSALAVASSRHRIKPTESKQKPMGSTTIDQWQQHQSAGVRVRAIAAADSVQELSLPC
jgi:hypothetical protein